MDLDGIAFDAFGTLFDLGELGKRFRARVLPLTMHATLTGHFRPLPEIASSTFGWSEDEAVARLTSLPAFDDVAEGLDALSNRPLAVLSNGTTDGVRALVDNAGIGDRFEHLLAADQAHAYKPSPELYALAPRAFDAPADRVLLVSGNEWDVAGAAQFGLRTVWVARGREPEWVFGIEPDAVVERIADVAAL